MEFQLLEIMEDRAEAKSKVPALGDKVDSDIGLRLTLA
jgi:hypothetical protein